MSIVVDTSVIMAVITNEKNKSKLIILTEGEELIAQISLHWEIGNAFSAMLKRKRIEFNLAMKALEYYHMIPLRFVEVDLKKSLEVSHRFNIYAYNAYFLECAWNYKSTLITLDNVLIKVAKQMNINVVEV